MRTTAGSFLNKLEYQMQMLNDKKTIETRFFEKLELYGPAPYTHVLFRLVERIRRAAGAQHHVVMATLAGRLGPFSSARAAVEAAALAKRKLGLSEDDLLKYMTRMRKIRSGPRKGRSSFRLCCTCSTTSMPGTTSGGANASTTRPGFCRTSIRRTLPRGVMGIAPLEAARQRGALQRRSKHIATPAVNLKGRY